MLRWDTLAVLLAVLAVVMNWCDRPREASGSAYLSLLATQLGRLRARQHAGTRAD